MSKGSSGNTNTIQKADPWVGAQPGLSTLYDAAQQNYLNGGPQYYPGQTVADQSQTTLQAQQAMYARAMAGSPVVGAADQQAMGTLNGDYLYANPAMQGMYDASNFNAMGMQGMDSLQNMGQGGLGDFYGQSGLNSIGYGSQIGSTDGLQGLNQIGAGSQLGTTMGLSDLQRMGQGAYVGRTNGTQQLQDIGNGLMLNKNPYIDSMFNQAGDAVGRNYANNVQPGIASMFAGAGRYGSQAMANGIDTSQRAYGDQMNNLATSIYGQNYANERTQQQNALNQLGQMGIAERGQQLGALGQLGQFSQGEHAQQLQALANAGQLSSSEYARQLQALQSAGQLDATNRGQQLSALQTLTGNQLQGQSLRNQANSDLSTAFGRERANQMQAMGMAPALANQDYVDINALMGLGAQQDARAQQLTNADIARWDFNQNQPTQNLFNLNSIMTGASPYAQQSKSGQQSYSNPFQTAMGAGMMGSQLYGMMGGAGAGMGLYGGGAGAAAMGDSLFGAGAAYGAIPAASEGLGAMGTAMMFM